MKKLFYYLLLPLLSISLAACGDDDNEPDNPGENPNVSVDDPEGTVTQKMLFDSDTYLGSSYIQMDDAYNFYGTNSYFVSLGQMKGLGNVTQIPVTGWATKVAAIPGCGYVAYSDHQFYRIYIMSEMVNTGGGVMGYTVKYQTPFAGPDEELQLETNALAFEENGGTATVKVLNNNFVPFSVTSSHEWVRASLASTSDFSFITDAVYIEVDDSGDNTQTEATVTLTTGSGKAATINITRSPKPFVALVSDIDNRITANPTGEERTIRMYGNVEPSRLSVYSPEEWYSWKIESPQKTSVPPYRLKYISGKPAPEDMKTSTGSSQLHNFNLILSVAPNTSGSYRSDYVYLTSNGNPSLFETVTTLSQDELRFSLERNAVSFTSDESTAAIRITTTATDMNAFTVKSSATWCKASIQQEESGGKPVLAIKAEANPSEDNRSATVEIILTSTGETLATLTVEQQAGKSISVQAETLYFDRKATNQTIAISVPADFRQEDIQCSESWLTATLTGTDKTGLLIRITDATENRTAVISFAGFSKQVEVRQSKYAVGDAYSENGVEGTVHYLENGTGRIYKEVGVAAWSTENVDIGASDENDGKKNMEVVKRQPNWQTLYPAFALVEELNSNGTTGWYLPAINECDGNWGEHWSSTEYDDSNAYCYYHAYGTYLRVERSKNSDIQVIAINQFEY